MRMPCWKIVLLGGHDVTMALHDQAEPPSCEFGVESMDTDTTRSRHGKEKDGFVKTMAILNSPMDGTLMGSIQYCQMGKKSLA